MTKEAYKKLHSTRKTKQVKKITLLRDCKPQKNSHKEMDSSAAKTQWPGVTEAWDIETTWESTFPKKLTHQWPKHHQPEKLPEDQSYLDELDPTPLIPAETPRHLDTTAHPAEEMPCSSRLSSAETQILADWPRCPAERLAPVAQQGQAHPNPYSWCSKLNLHCTCALQPGH